MIVNNKIIDNYNITNQIITDIFSQSVYIDIETSGFSAETNDIVSITFLVEENNSKIIYQLFSINEQDEKEALQFLVNHINKKNYIITYNGKTFDINFLNTKLKKYNILFSLDTLIGIDLYRDIQCLKNKLATENNKLKTIEKYFGINRADTLSGKDIIKLYNSYKIHLKDVHKELILAHNYEDVLYLPIIFDNILNEYECKIYSDKIGLLKFTRSNIEISNKTIKIKASNIINNNNINNMDYICNKSAYKLVYKYETISTKINLFTTYYSAGSGNYIMYINNNELHLDEFNTLSNLQPNIIPLVINDAILLENIIYVVKKIILDM